MKKTLQDILNMDVEEVMKLGREDLKDLTKQLAYRSNQRIARLEKSGISQLSPSYRAYTKRGEKYSAKSTNINELRQQFYDAKSFLSHSTSTIKGTKELVNKWEESLNPTGDKKSHSVDFWTKFFELYDKVMESAPAKVVKAEQGSPTIKQQLYDIMENNEDMDDDAILTAMEKEVQDRYDYLQYRSSGGGFFTI